MEDEEEKIAGGGGGGGTGTRAASTLDERSNSESFVKWGPPDIDDELPTTVTRLGDHATDLGCGSCTRSWDPELDAEANPALGLRYLVAMLRLSAAIC